MIKSSMLKKLKNKECRISDLNNIYLQHKMSICSSDGIMQNTI